MRRTLVAITVAVLVAASGGWVALSQPGPGAAPGDATTSQKDDGRPYDWMPERSGDGEPPTLQEAMTELQDVGYVEISGNDEFVPAHGVQGGSGTPEDPYVIRGVYARELDIRDTDAWFEIQSSYVETLRLNWNDQSAWVHHNHIGDLRVNENDPRTGNATGGVIEHNEIGVVGQIRHFDGAFRHNVVGEQKVSTNALWDAFDETINVDGYVNAEFHDNEIFGQVTIDLHGHGHASCRGCHPHNHYASMDAEERRMDHEDYDPEDYEDKPLRNVSHPHEMDHSRRYHTIRFHDNVVEDGYGRGIYIEDRNHAGDDRTADSEPDPDVEGDHWHDILIDVRDNVVRKAGIEVDVMYAQDMYHVPGGQAEIRIVDNTVEAEDRDLVELSTVRHATVLVEDNELVRRDDGVGWEAAWAWAGSDGIQLREIVDGTVSIQRNEIVNVERGVAAREMPGNTTWSVVDNTFVSVQEPVWWDDSVENEPEMDGNEQRSGSASLAPQAS